MILAREATAARVCRCSLRSACRPAVCDVSIEGRCVLGHRCERAFNLEPIVAWPNKRAEGVVGVRECIYRPALHSGSGREISEK